MESFTFIFLVFLAASGNGQAVAQSAPTKTILFRTVMRVPQAFAEKN